MRKLATIRTIKELRPIEGADLIELAIIDGWQVVVKKGEFNINDQCVFAEIDSVLPDDNPEFEFMRKHKFRIKTIKLRKCLSQGLLFPISILPPAYYSVGDDLTEILKITKYEVPCSPQLAGLCKGGHPNNWPPFLRKTDECRVQNLDLEQFKSIKLNWFIHEKMDGCLDKETIVSTELGNITIGEICENKLKIKVNSYNTENQEIEQVEIINYSILTNKNNWYNITLEDGTTLLLTGNHRVWVDNLNCYRKVEDLDGTEILLKN